MEINDFFNEIKVPEFLASEFKKNDWPLMVGRLKDVIKTNVQESHIPVNNDTLIIHGLVYIGKNCTFGDYVVIEGPAYIGDDVEISSHALIRAGSVIGNGCSVGHAGEVKSSIMMDKSRVANHAFLGDSILGVSGRLGGHSETQNRKFDQTEIVLKYKNEEIQTHLEKYGAIIGEGSRLSGGVFTSPGCMIGKNTFVMSGVRLEGFIPQDTFIKLTDNYEVRPNKFSGTLNNKFKYIENDENK